MSPDIFRVTETVPGTAHTVYPFGFFRNSSSLNHVPALDECVHIVVGGTGVG